MRALVLGFLLAASPLAQAAQDLLDRFYAEVGSIDARFEQRLLDDEGQTLESFRGHFSLSRPNKFVWQYESPYELELGSDGDVLWHHDVGLRQITLRDAGAVLTGTPAELLGGGAEQLAAFDVRAEPGEGKMRWIVLKPRDETSDFEVIRVGFEGAVPRAMHLRDRLGQTTQMRFEDVSVNPVQPADRYLLRLPDGVDIVDDRGGG